MSIQRQLVRVLRWFPEQNVSFGKIRSGKRVIFRTKCLCCGEKEFFLPLCPGGLSYRSRNWEESPGRKGQCTVESTDRRRVYARVTENYRRRSAQYFTGENLQGFSLMRTAGNLWLTDCDTAVRVKMWGKSPRIMMATL